MPYLYSNDPAGTHARQRAPTRAPTREGLTLAYLVFYLVQRSRRFAAVREVQDEAAAKRLTIRPRMDAGAGRRDERRGQEARAHRRSRQRRRRDARPTVPRLLRRSARPEHIRGNLRDDGRVRKVRNARRQTGCSNDAAQVQGTPRLGLRLRVQGSGGRAARRGLLALRPTRSNGARPPPSGLNPRHAPLTPLPT